MFPFEVFSLMKFQSLLFHQERELFHAYEKKVIENEKVDAKYAVVFDQKGKPTVVEVCCEKNGK
jgi:hypothetical protein